MKIKKIIFYKGIKIVERTKLKLVPDNCQEKKKGENFLQSFLRGSNLN